jgi:hypothetical protein
MGGKPALIAAEVKRGDETLTLRDGNGVPVVSQLRADVSDPAGVLEAADRFR